MVSPCVAESQAIRLTPDMEQIVNLHIEKRPEGVYLRASRCSDVRPTSQSPPAPDSQVTDGHTTSRVDHGVPAPLEMP